MKKSTRSPGFPVPSRGLTKGFTLIELLVVIAIIAILAAILFPVFAKVRENARKITCASNQKQIGLAILQYVQDNDEDMVPRNVNDYGDGFDHIWSQIMQPYVKDQNVFQCPSNPRKDKKFCCQNPDPVVGSGYASYAANYQGGIRDVGNGGTPISYATFDAPAQIIDIVESTAQYSDFNVDYPPLWGVDYASGNLATGGSYGPNQNPGCLFSGHTGLANFLFVDGHVKAMRPLASLDKTDGGSNDVNLWRYDNDSFVHHQMLDAAAGIGPLEPNPTRAQVDLAWSEKLYK